MDEHTLCVIYDCPLVNEFNAMQFFQHVNGNLSPDINHLYLLLNTPGGSVNLGIEIYNFLKALPVKVSTHNIGQVDSIGNVIFVAGEERFATPNSTFLFHGIAGSWTNLSVPQAREALSQLENDEKRMTAILREHTDLGPRQLTEFYRQGRSVAPEEAMEKKIINKVKEVEISPTARRVVIPTARPN